MKVHRFERMQNIPIPIEQAWEFFSSPANLAKITPPSMGFRILTDISDDCSAMYPGMIIQYTVRPLFSIPLTWVTEITHAEKPRFFVDEQRFGPYRFWHHQHHFRAVNGGTEARDIVSYALPFGILGDAVAGRLVDRQLAAVFDYRKEALKTWFPL